jgi:hypothetical protein
VKCDYCKKEIVRSATGFLEQELTPFLYRTMTGTSGDNRLGNYFVCHGLSCKRQMTLQDICDQPLKPSVMYMTQELFDEFKEFEKETELFDADPNCKHEIVDAPGGGVKCSKCTGWFCF